MISEKFSTFMVTSIKASPKTQNEGVIKNSQRLKTFKKASSHLEEINKYNDNGKLSYK